LNIIDYIVIGMIALYVLNGIYRGFLPSLLNLGGFFASWILAFFTYPLLSRTLVGGKLFSSLQFYVEGAEKLGDLFEMGNLPVSQISSNQLSGILDACKLAPPFDTAIASNVSKQAFAKQGLTTLAEYFDQTIYNVIINILSLLIIFFVLRLLFTLLTNAFSFSSQMPQLRRFDATLGGGIGFVRGFLSMYLLFAVMPVIMIMFNNVAAVTDLVNGSRSCTTFYTSSVILRYISGVI